MSISKSPLRTQTNEPLSPQDHRKTPSTRMSVFVSPTGGAVPSPGPTLMRARVLSAGAIVSEIPPSS